MFFHYIMSCRSKYFQNVDTNIKMVHEFIYMHVFPQRIQYKLFRQVHSDVSFSSQLIAWFSVYYFILKSGKDTYSKDSSTV